MDMAVPQPTDARMPCPVCRAPIHPIAGRCKHCKTDLATLRQVRPAAGAALPALAASTPAARPPPPQVVVPVAAAYGANGMVTITDDPSQPILPPRPTGRMGTATVSKRPAWRSWPVIVIMLATVAIVAAVVLMAFPPGGAAADTGTPGGKRGLEPPPAPEHMDQNPLVPGAPHSKLTPPAPPATPDPLPPPRHTPDPLPVDPDPDPDPFAGLGLHGGGRGAVGKLFNGASGIGMMGAVLKHGCERMKQCGSTADTIRMTCDLTLRSLPQQAVPSCPAAQRCLDRVDQMSCGATGDDMTVILGLMTSLQDCVEAMSC